MMPDMRPIDSGGDPALVRACGLAIGWEWDRLGRPAAAVLVAELPDHPTLLAVGMCHPVPEGTSVSGMPISVAEAIELRDRLAELVEPRMAALLDDLRDDKGGSDG